MIQGELKTALRWYDDINKQNRYKSNCAASCEYALISPLNIVPPFLFDTELIGVNILAWTFNCLDGTEIFSAEPGILEKFDSLTLVDTDYIQYSGASPVPDLDLICGTYYMIIETDQGSFYSELINFIDIDNPTFSQIDLPLFSAWRWYDNVLKQNKFKSHCAASCDFNLIVPNDNLIPFQFRIPFVLTPDITRWYLRNEDCEYELNANFLTYFNEGFDEFTYIISNALQSPAQVMPIELPNGDFSGSGSWDETFSSDPANIGWQIASNRGRFRVNAGMGSSIFANSLDPFLEVTAGQDYYITYEIVQVVGTDMSFQMRLGGTLGAIRTAAGEYSEMINAASDGVIELIGNKTSAADTGFLTVDDITVATAEPLPCGTFESVVVVDGVEYFSEWIKIVGEEDARDNLDYLLLESGDYLLLESGERILLEIQD